GFLAENAEFAERVEAAGLTWVGPPPAAIRLMGSKTESRKLARKAGAPLIPGLLDPLESVEELEAFAREHGFPLLLKAVAGGGGKGMRRVDSMEELAAAFDRARSEGAAYFGDDRVYVERLAERPRHIEVQVAADAHGNAVAVGERECSIQRRHQKVVEECPSPVVTPEVRQRLYDAALAVVRASGYRSVGTVEFLYDSSGEVYFLEMNTRLQVEHPVTEEVYGVDLVREQIRIALGETLSWRQEDLVPRGHAIECRVYAEDPFRGFSPSPGRISFLREPGGPGVRVDSGVIEGDVVPLDYDPMLAKLIVWAPDRPAAVERLARALGEYCIAGIATTLPLFRLLARLPDFRAARFHTSYLDELLGSEELDELRGPADPEVDRVAILAAACLATLEAGHLSGDPFEHARRSHWWEEGARTLQGRFPR
ncbi:MAG TPA: ATP-grasp domain-containing protein, partial [Acidobacteria bacterium]|nr:ATP-grasp domain-containing protein [Acidobacteriota bacterium]